jgi:hypothetical protein
MTKPKRVEVIWVDASGPSMWLDTGEANASTLAECTSIGYLFSKTKEWVKIVQSYEKDRHMVGNLLTIPRRNVKKIIRLR